MGVLLAFMFVVNVLGAIFLLPALACWLEVGKKNNENSGRAVSTPARSTAAEQVLRDATEATR